MYAKSVIVLLWWATSYALWVASGIANWHWWVSLAFAASFGLAVVCLAFNVMHDANHGGYSDNLTLNRFLGYSCDLIGLSTFMWRQQHNIWHHTYTNIAGLDEALETDGWLRSSPKDVWKPMHRFQHLYAPFVYAFGGIVLILVRNFVVYFTGRSSEHFAYPPMSPLDKMIFWAGRSVNLTLYFLIPAAVFPWWLAVAGFLAFSLTASSVMAHVLMLAHVSNEVEFVEPTGDPLCIANEWAVHQVRATMNFSPGNALVNWYVGGLNYQIEHHLFPHICHLVYPRIAPIVEQTCREFLVPYHSNPGFINACWAHYKSLKAFGKRPYAANRERRR
jgi:linoleoyl-CoA desaturase